ncbi:MAG: hypothetical protein JNM63_18980 [Spirochaetia bacterium]|nr:hypothetical protein [Spirochaetia bacterium]
MKIKVSILEEPMEHESDSLRRMAPKIEKFLFASGSFKPFKVWFEARDWELTPSGHFQKKLRFFQFVQVRDDIFNIRSTGYRQPENYYRIHGFFPGDRIDMVVVLR